MINTINTPSPSCRCGDCVLRPESSHNIYAIGVYHAPSRLSRRGGKITNETVSYWFPFDMARPNGGMGLQVPIFDSASDVRYINNF